MKRKERRKKLLEKWETENREKGSRKKARKRKRRIKGKKEGKYRRHRNRKQ